MDAFSEKITGSLKTTTLQITAFMKIFY